MHGDSSSVRLAQPEDEDALVALCRVHHGEEAMRDAGGVPFPFSEERVRAMVQKTFIKDRNADDGQAFCGVIGTAPDLQATIYLTKSGLWYSERPILKEIFAIVAPAYRKTQHARSLAAFSKIISACLEMTLVAEVTAQRIEAKERFYARSYGAGRFGAFYAFDPTPGA